jgi:maltose alpha-D-glucosyltransferase/alpha-amylase
MATSSTSNPRWYQDAVIYQLHVKVYRDSNGDGIGDFRGLIGKLDYLQDLGITAIWLLPFYPSPLRDDGYDTADYRQVHPSYGDLGDFREFVTEAKSRGLRVITELVLNHTSDQHEWFQRARRAPAGHPDRDWYVWSDTVHKYEDTRIIFKDFEASNWSWDPVAGAYYWHRFYAHQPDLNWDNPAVVQELYSIVDYWLDMGVDGLRLDAVPYLFEREGTNCENLPETHQALKDLRAHVDANHEDKMLLAEANMWPDEVVDYFGDGDECHMAFHFPLMPRMFMAIRMEDRFPIIDILDETPDIPQGAQWAIFLRNHDELTLEMVTDEERDYMWRIYARDERARINLGIRRRLAPLLGNNRRLIELMMGLLFSLPGTPVIYYGDEIGMGDNIYLGDRDGVRTPMQWSADRNAGFSDANPQRLYLPTVADPEYHAASVNVEAQWANPESLLWWTKRMIAERRRHPALGHGALEWVRSENHKVLTFLRVTDEEQILCVVNLSRYAQHAELDLSGYLGARPVELHGHVEFPPIGTEPYVLTLGPHDCFWFVLEADASGVAVEGTLPVLTVAGSDWQQLLADATSRARLERLLPAYIAAQPWFRGSRRQVRGATINEVLPVGDAGLLALVDLQFGEGDPDTYLLTLATQVGDAPVDAARGALARVGLDDGVQLTLVDGLDDPTFCSALLQALVHGQSLAGSDGTVEVRATEAMSAIAARGTVDTPRAVAAELGSSIVAFGDRYALKLFRYVDEGENPDAELGRFLTEHARFTHAPPVAATLEYRRTDGAGKPRTFAVLQGYVEHESDAWALTLDALRRYVDEAIARPDLPPDTINSLLARARSPLPDEAHETIGAYLEHARVLGTRTAELHIALASAPEDSDLAPEPMTPMYRRSLYQAMRSSTKRTFATLRPLAVDQPDLAEVLELEDEIAERLRGLLDVTLEDTRIRVHGDLHLAQVLWTGRDFCFVDFEGEPLRPIGERRIKRSAIKDVAAMLRSFDFAAWTVWLERRELYEPGPNAERITHWIEFWQRCVSATFLRAYLEVAGDAGFLTTVDADLDTLIDAMRIDKALYELEYEARVAPERVWIPARGLRQLLADRA